MTLCLTSIILIDRNFALSFAAGNATIWKPSPTTPLCSIAVTKIVSQVLERNGIPGAAASLVTGGKDVGAAVVESRDIELGNHSCTGTVIQLYGRLTTAATTLIYSFFHW